MQKFLVLYMAPVAVLDEWMQKPEAERQAAEAKMKADWDAWASQHSAALKETAGAGKTKQISAAGVADIRNDIMLFSLIEAESPDEAAKMFEGHPHFGIPQATIQIMPANYLPGME